MEVVVISVQIFSVYFHEKFQLFCPIYLGGPWFLKGLQAPVLTAVDFTALNFDASDLGPSH